MYNCPKGIEGLTSSEVSYATNNSLLNVEKNIGGSSILSIISKNTFNLFNLINVVLALFLFIAHSYKNMLFIFVAILNTLIATIQEIRAKKISQKLNLLSKKPVAAIRDGVVQQIHPNDLALYDLLVLNQGEQVPADSQIIKGKVLVNEAFLTGETKDVVKVAGDSVFGGSFISEGKAYFRITAVGESSYINKIQKSAKVKNENNSVLLKAMNTILLFSCLILIPISLVLAYKYMIIQGMPFDESIPKIAGVVIGMLPSGLILLTSVALAVGVIKLSELNVLVNHLNGIENLARVDTICFDKTGTITTGKMQLDRYLLIDGFCEERFKEIINYFLQNMPDNNSTITALRNYFNVIQTDLSEDINFVPFNSERKWSSIEYDNKTIILGAPKFISSNKDTLKYCDVYTNDAYRVLLMLQTDSKIDKDSDIKSLDTQAIALFLIKDELRKDIKDVIKYFYDQNVNIKLISGDDGKTVLNIANEVGIKSNNSFIENELDINENTIDINNIFSRIKPYMKSKIIELLKSKKRYVAMTGDGVNDIPALKMADCSIAMGEGSQACKNSAQLVILDNNFAVLPKIVLEGRRVINNISLCASLFLNKTLFSAILAIFCLIFSHQYPFEPIQLTILSSLTIGIPSFLLSFQPNHSILDRNFIKKVFLRAIPGGIGTGLILVILIALSKSIGFSYYQLSTCALIFSFISLFISMYFIIFPLNKFKIAVLSACVILGLLAILLFPSIFNIKDLNLKVALVAVSLGVISLLLQTVLFKLINAKLLR